MGNTGKNTVYDDFKYVLQDVGTIYIGCKYTYLELMERDEVAFKLKAVAEHYLLREVDEDTTLESHFYYMNAQDFACRTYQQLKVRIKVSERDRGKGNHSAKYSEHVYRVQDFAVLTAEQKENRGIVIQEIQFPKLALMTFTV